MPDFKRKRIRLPNFDYPSGSYVYFITIRTNSFKPYFLKKELAQLVETTLDFRIKQKEVLIYCYCIMPDHLHMLLSLEKEYDKSLSNWISSFKRFISKEAKSKFGIQTMWHRNYYDHVVRREESLSTICDYILSNPIRKNIVDNWEDYPFSRLYV